MRENEVKLDTVTDTIVGLFRDYLERVESVRCLAGSLDWDGIAIQTRRILRDECMELWQDIANEAEE